MPADSDYIPGDWDYLARLVPHRKKGKTMGFYVHLTRESIARALNVKPEEIPENVRALRIVLDPGTKQILIRLKLEK